MRGDNRQSGGKSKSYSFSNNNQERQKRDDDVKNMIQLNQNSQQQRRRRDSGDRREGGSFRDSPRRDSGDRREGGSFRDSPRREQQTPKKTLTTTVQTAQKTYQKTMADAKSKGINKPGVQPGSQGPAQTSELPNLDDINNEFNTNKDNGRGVRRSVSYEEQYATTGVKNKLKDRYKRGKKSKKGSSVFGTLEGKSGNSVLDSYRNLGKRLRG